MIPFAGHGFIVSLRLPQTHYWAGGPVSVNEIYRDGSY